MTVVERLVEELGVTNSNHIKGLYTLCHLQRQKHKITEKDKFWGKIGFKINNNHHELISIMAKNPLLSNMSKHTTKTKRLLEQLVVELDLSNVLNEELFPQYLKHIIGDALCVNQYDEIALENIDENSESVMNKVIAKYTFTINHINSVDPGKTFLDKLYEFVEQHEKITQQQMQSLKQFLNEHEYDTDPVQDDFHQCIQNQSTANIYNNFKNESWINLITNFIKVQNVPEIVPE
eukprot:16438_1